MPYRAIYFDIDGVLNDTPQLGSRQPWIYPEVWERLRALAGRDVLLVCVSFHRHYPENVRTLCGDGIHLAPNGAKRKAVPRAPDVLVIDDQPNEYEGVTVYAVNGRVGLTDQDFENLARLLKEDHDGGKNQGSA